MMDVCGSLVQWKGPSAHSNKWTPAENTISSRNYVRPQMQLPSEAPTIGLYKQAHVQQNAKEKNTTKKLPVSN